LPTLKTKAKDAFVNNPPTGQDGLFKPTVCVDKNKKKFKIRKTRASPRDGRGPSDDPRDIVEELVAVWDDFLEALSEADESVQREIKDHFNNLIEGEPNLGDILFGPVGEFEDSVKILDDELVEIYINELENTEIIENTSE